MEAGGGNRDFPACNSIRVLHLQTLRELWMFTAMNLRPGPALRMMQLLHLGIQIPFYSIGSSGSRSFL